MTTQEELVDETYRLMRKISELSDKARAAGDKNLMYATNRAWHEISAHQARVERAPLSNGERA